MSTDEDMRAVARAALKNGFTLVTRVIPPGEFAALVAVRHTFSLSLRDGRAIVKSVAAEGQK